jgi:radical SAM protein with 4Fe4S-binding SPASM domain
VRICNHLPNLLGNLRERPFHRIIRQREVAEFCRALPDRCAACAHAATCRGGCKAAALVCYGSLRRGDPVVEESDT